MVFKINDKGELFYKKRKRELFKFFYTFPFFIGLISLLFILGAKNSFHLYFSIFLVSMLTILVLLSMFSIMKNLNNTVCEIDLNDTTIKIKSFSVLFMKGKELKIEKDEIKLIPKRFRISKKEEEQGWMINTLNCKLSLIKDFFNSNLMNDLQNI